MHKGKGLFLVGREERPTFTKRNSHYYKLHSRKCREIWKNIESWPKSPQTLGKICISPKEMLHPERPSSDMRAKVQGRCGNLVK